MTTPMEVKNKNPTINSISQTFIATKNNSQANQGKSNRDTTLFRSYASQSSGQNRITQQASEEEKN
jgi:hypothetical protein